MKTGERNFDKLFRDRLEGMEIEPSTEAFARIDHIIARKRNRLIVKRLAIAAGVVILLSAGFLFTRSLKPSVPVQLSGNSIKPANPDAALRPLEKKGQTIPEKKAAENRTVAQGGRQAYNPGMKKLSGIQKAVEPVLPDSAIETEQRIAKSEIVEPLGKKFMNRENENGLRKPVPFSSGHPKKPVIEPGPVVIEYIADDHALKTGKISLLAGILHKAKAIGKDISYGEIRDLKDQLFALQFIKTDKETQNSK